MPVESIYEDLFTRNVFVKRNEQSIYELMKTSDICRMARLTRHYHRRVTSTVKLSMALVERQMRTTLRSLSPERVQLAS